MNGTYVMGFDLSSKKIAVTVTDLDDPSFLYMATFTLVKDETRRCHEAMRWTSDLVGTFLGARVYAFVEKPVLGRGGAGSTIPQAQVNGAVIAGAWEGSAHEVMSVNNQQWKKSVIGNGNASKAQIKAGIFDLWHDAYQKADGDQDLLDSAGVNRFGVQVLKMHERIKAEREDRMRVKRLVKPKRLVKR